jgi:predicted PolB exonuclease-like 3'-5' exonuclease
MDLMDILAAYQARASAPLDAIATMLGFPGKMGMHGSQVWDYFKQGDIASIRHYCETDVLNTYLIYLRFELMRGELTPSEYQQQCQHLRAMLAENQQPHLQAFLQAWHE